MKLFELKITKKIGKVAHQYFKSDSYDAKYELQKQLKKLGWKELGSGAFSHVWENPNKSYVLKINSQPDIGYATYVKIIKKHKNKHFPKISEMKVWKVGRHKFYIYAIEKLYRVTGQSSRDLAYELGNIMEDPKRPLEKLLKHQTKYLRNHPDLVKAAIIIGKDGDGIIDMHGENIMQRKDGTIIITDPLWVSNYY